MNIIKELTAIIGEMSQEMDLHKAEYFINKATSTISEYRKELDKASINY